MLLTVLDPIQILSFQSVRMSYCCSWETSQNKGETPDLRWLQIEPGFWWGFKVLLLQIASITNEDIYYMAVLRFEIVNSHKFPDALTVLSHFLEMLEWIPTFFYVFLSPENNRGRNSLPVPAVNIRFIYFILTLLALLRILTKKSSTTHIMFNVFLPTIYIFFLEWKQLL